MTVAVHITVTAVPTRASEPVQEHKNWTEADWSKAIGQLHRGMTSEEVGKRLGKPRRTARQILFHRYLEQWLYDEPRSLRLEFDCRRGQQPLLITEPSETFGAM
jgi:hypothetical protein